MTWAALSVRLGAFLLLLPLVLTRLSSADIVVWYLFASIISMQWLFDLGFSTTISRSISHAMAGVTAIGRVDARGWVVGGGEPNWDLVGAAIAVGRRIYFWLALSSLFLIGTIGTYALVRPISAVGNPVTAWTAWIAILVSSPLGMWASVYANYLEGTNRVALVRRWDMLLGLASLASGAIVLLLGGELLALVLATQSWTIVRILRDRALCHWVDGGRFRSFVRLKFQPDMLRSIWPSTWRTGIGSLTSYGLIYGGNLLIAQVASTSTTASYLVSMKLIESVAQLSMAPFYSQLPAMARKRAEGDQIGLVALARRGMAHALWVFVAGFIFVGLSADRLLLLIGSNATFAAPGLWILMGIAFLVHRFGAMHVQLYSTTNHVTSHIADFVSGVIFVIVAVVLLGRIGVYALPAGLLCGYVGFYAWYAATQSYRSIGTTFLLFERNVAMPPFAAMAVYCSITLSSL